MRKIIAIFFIFVMFSSVVPAANAVNIGTYKTETEYGLLDGFKINWKRKDKSTPFIEPREESDKHQRQRDLKYQDEDEYYRTKYMYEGKSIL